MHKRFSSRQITTMVVAICAAAVLTPVAVMAATGNPVNIVDPYIGARVARVDAGGNLRGADRSSELTSNALRATAVVNDKVVLIGDNSPRGAAITQLTLSAYGTGQYLNVGIYTWVRTSGTGTCGSVEVGTTTGFSATSQRIVTVRLNDTLSLNFDGGALVAKAAGGAAGTPWCVTAHVVSAVASSFVFYVGATYYRPLA